MATITEIASTDTLSASRSAINTNFDNLNTDKLESSDLPSASESAEGMVELATDAETQTGTATDVVITPANLQACTATDARKGVVELATSAEVQTGTDTTRAVTPAGIAAATIQKCGTMFRYGYTTNFSHASATTTYINVLAGTNDARATINAWMHWNNGDGCRAIRFYVFCNYNNASQYIQEVYSSGDAAFLITCTYSSGYFRLGIQTTSGYNGRYGYDITTETKANIVVQ